MVGYHGSVFIDKRTTAVTRITLEAEDIPPDFPVHRAKELLDYDFVALRKNSTGSPIHAAFSKATNSIFVAARRWAFSSR